MQMILSPPPEDTECCIDYGRMVLLVFVPGVIILDRKGEKHLWFGQKVRREKGSRIT